MKHEDRQEERRQGVKFSAKWVLLVFIAIAAYFLITEHRAHLSGSLTYLPFLLLLACPLLHLFMRGGHGSETGGTEHEHASQQGERK